MGSESFELRNYRFDWRILHNIHWINRRFIESTFGIFVLNGELFGSLRLHVNWMETVYVCFLVYVKKWAAVPTPASVAGNWSAEGSAPRWMFSKVFKTFITRRERKCLASGAPRKFVGKLVSRYFTSDNIFWHRLESNLEEIRMASLIKTRYRWWRQFPPAHLFCDQTVRLFQYNQQKITRALEDGDLRLSWKQTNKQTNKRTNKQTNKTKNKTKNKNHKTEPSVCARVCCCCSFFFLFFPVGFTV